MKVEHDIIASHVPSGIGFERNLLLPETPDEAKLFVQIAAAIFRSLGFAPEDRTLQWPSGSTYGEVRVDERHEITLRLVVESGKIEVFFDDQPMAKAAPDWYGMLNKLGEVESEPVDEPEPPPAGLAILARLDARGKIVEVRKAKRGRRPSGFVRAFRAADGTLTSEDGRPLGHTPLVPG